MPLTVAHKSSELDVRAVKVAKGFVSIHRQRLNVMSPKMADHHCTRAYVMSSNSTWRFDVHLNVESEPFQQSETTQNYLTLVVHLGIVIMHSVR